MKEKRKYPRIAVSFPVECENLPSRDYFYTVSKDLSEGGVKILSNNFIPKDNYLKLNLNLIDKILDLKAKVVWCNKERIAERYLTGLKFVEVDNLAKAELSKFINTIHRS